MKISSNFKIVLIPVNNLFIGKFNLNNTKITSIPSNTPRFVGKFDFSNIKTVSIIPEFNNDLEII